MIRRHQGIAQVLVVTCFGGAFLGSAVVASAADQAGKTLYQKNCQSCHGANGTPPPALAKSMKHPSSHGSGAAAKERRRAAPHHCGRRRQNARVFEQDVTSRPEAGARVYENVW